MRWWIYNALFAVGYTLMLPRFLLRMWKRGGYRKHFMQRFAVYSDDVRARLAERPRVWIHAVSVGEIFVAFRFMEEFRVARPGTAFVLSTTTSTGYRIAQSKLDPEDVLLYYPADFPPIVKRALNLLSPEALILTECELWPNMIRKARERGIPVVLINGRISERSYSGYRRIRAFVEPVLRSMTLLLVQTDADRRRLENLGAEPDNLRVVGTAKYDIIGGDAAGEEDARRALAAIGCDRGDPVIVGGSTWPGEERILMDVYRDLKPAYPGLRLVLVPRHAERGPEVSAEIDATGLSYCRRSTMQAEESGSGGAADVLLVDTTGELRNFYACASVIFVGKSMTSRGGQNPIEPALLAKPVVVGPHMENFPEVMEDFLKADAMLQVRDASGLVETLRRLLDDPALRDTYGKRAHDLVIAKQGAAQTSVKLILEVMDGPGRH